MTFEVQCGRISMENYFCLCEASVYGGYRFHGSARSTIGRGRVMLDEFETVGTPGWDRYVPRDAAGGGS